MEEAAKSADDVKKIVNKAVEQQAISHEDAAEIKKAADNVKAAATSGDQDAAIEHAKLMQDRVEEVVMSKQPEVAENLKKIDEIKGNKHSGHILFWDLSILGRSDPLFFRDFLESFRPKPRRGVTLG